MLPRSITAGLGLLVIASAKTWPTDIVGTWSTKSNQTLTGPGFYDPIHDELIEPSHTGISYSFTSNGFYEEAYYRAVANPTDPKCPSGIMQWQHGSWVMESNNSLVLTPIAVDGRQLTSTPCQYSNSLYTRYNQSEVFQKYAVYTDPFHNIPRLDLYQFNGAPMAPMYLAFSPPQMLPTTTLTPVTSSTGAAAATSGSKLKRSSDHPHLNLALSNHQTASMVHRIDADRLWWAGLVLTGVGGLLYLGPRRLGTRR